MGTKPSKLTVAQQDLLYKANTIISSMTTYGMQKVVLKKSAWKLIWSNSGANWDRSFYKNESGETVSLDANQFLLEGAMQDINAILSHLDPLPLYRYSTEGKRKPTTPWGMNSVGPRIRGIDVVGFGSIAVLLGVVAAAFLTTKR